MWSSQDYWLLILNSCLWVSTLFHQEPRSHSQTPFVLANQQLASMSLITALCIELLPAWGALRHVSENHILPMSFPHNNLSLVHSVLETQFSAELPDWSYPEKRWLLTLMLSELLCQPKSTKFKFPQKDLAGFWPVFSHHLKKSLRLPGRWDFPYQAGTKLKDHKLLRLA